MTIAAFVSSKAATRLAPMILKAPVTLAPAFLSPSASPTVLASSTSDMVSALFRGAGKLADHSDVAISFFGSIRTPAALLTGSALAALFSMLDRTQPEAIAQQSRAVNAMVLGYHILALASFLMSLNVIITSTAAGNSLLLGMNDPLAMSPFELMRRELDFEFSLTCWSFYVSQVVDTLVPAQYLP
jgi:hypothetical protein